MYAKFIGEDLIQHGFLKGSVYHIETIPKSGEIYVYDTESNNKAAYYNVEAMLQHWELLGEDYYPNKEALQVLNRIQDQFEGRIQHMESIEEKNTEFTKGRIKGYTEVVSVVKNLKATTYRPPQNIIDNLEEQAIGLEKEIRKSIETLTKREEELAKVTKSLYDFCQK